MGSIHAKIATENPQPKNIDQKLLKKKKMKRKKKKCKTLFGLSVLTLKTDIRAVCSKITTENIL